MADPPIPLRDVFVICISPIIHLVYTPSPSPPKTRLSIVPNLFWDDCNTQEKLKIKGYAKFWRVNKVYYWRSADGEINPQIMDHAVIRFKI